MAYSFPVCKANPVENFITFPKKTSHSDKGGLSACSDCQSNRPLVSIVMI